ncbi:MAG: 16S rRNA (cytosine(1402)-N(4))-methyltransferase RsmH [Hormoscilla sp. SP5CHS1]|nr:16S rRNA (cytosine(1402)-N(4))-methyltransferase RsmH [Hormoscilla sp. SP12CHS1]MBC6455064.1 16S rRNA (cytosine(1402)-N(4))-methyltransferase RsmH [Hormoscilla sp. SP5CHS1]
MVDLIPSRSTPTFAHIPVLSRELIAGLEVRPAGHYLDATVGAGGHTQMLLAAGPDLRVTALDRDGEAIAHVRSLLASEGDRLQICHINFAEYRPQHLFFDGIVADLGVSSAQLDIAERGFSFRHPAEIDMRMDRRQTLTAAEIVNHWEEVKLADIFYQYGEERLSRRIARSIVQRRPFQTTDELATAIAWAVPRKYRYGRIHPATRVFQALRIAVNQELESLSEFLKISPNWLKPGGKIAIISFHSLEDRLVKHSFRESPLLRVLTKKPITAQGDELAANPRSRSAKLRIAEQTPVIVKIEVGPN